MKKTYVKLYRTCLDHTLLGNDINAYVVFTKLLLRVDWQTGTLVTGRARLVTITGIKRGTLYDVLRRLEKADMLSVKSTKFNTTITITNWAKYQGQDDDFSQEITKSSPRDNQQPSQQPSQQPITPVILDTPNNQANNTPKSSPRDSQEIANNNSNNTITKNKETISKLSNNNLPVVGKKPTPTELALEVHKELIDDMVAKFEESLGFPLKSLPTQRKAALSVIKRLTAAKAMDAVTAALGCQDDQYAPRIANLVQLDKKLDNLLVYYKGKNNAHKQQGRKVGVVI